MSINWTGAIIDFSISITLFEIMLSHVITPTQKESQHSLDEVPSIKQIKYERRWLFCHLTYFSSVIYAIIWFIIIQVSALPDHFHQQIEINVGWTFTLYVNMWIVLYKVQAKSIKIHRKVKELIVNCCCSMCSGA